MVQAGGAELSGSSETALIQPLLNLQAVFVLLQVPCKASGLREVMILLYVEHCGQFWVPR